MKRRFNGSVLWGLLLVAVFAACGEEQALLQVDLLLPATQGPGTRSWTRTEARAGTSGSFDWSGGEGLPENLRVTPVVLPFGIESQEDTGVRIRVRFCFEPTCEGVLDAVGTAPQVEFRFARSHYLLETTRISLSIEQIPRDSDSTENLVGKCDLAGCGAPMNSAECLATGRHACE